MLKGRTLGFACLVAWLVGCGSTRRSGFDDGTSSDPNKPGGLSNFSGTDGNGGLDITPHNATVIIDTATTPPTPGKVTFQLALDGQDLTSNAIFTVEDDSLGSFAGATFTSKGAIPGNAPGVSTTVKGVSPSGTGFGRLTIVPLKKTGPQRDFFFVVPFNQPPTPQSDVLKFGTNLQQVDVVFNMDTTGSMSGSIDNLKSALAGTLLKDLQSAIPNVGLAVVDFRDFPGSGGHGDAGDWPVRVRQKITTSLTAAQAAVGQYSAGGGGDGPEGDVPAMQHILTGEGITWPDGTLPAATPAAGRWGAVDFRPGSVPVVVDVTDITWHDENHDPYEFPAPSMASLKAAFAAKHAFFVSITSGDESQANDLSDATNSHVPASAFTTCGSGKCCTGVSGGARSPSGPGGTCRLNFQHSLGTGVANGIVTAIRAISGSAIYDVTAKAENDPANANGVDATKFIKTLRAMDEGNAAAGCPAASAKDADGDGVKDTFLALKVGTPVCFEVIPQTNTTVSPADVAQFFNAFIDVVGVPGDISLDRRSVLFLVPPTDVVVH